MASLLFVSIPSSVSVIECNRVRSPAQSPPHRLATLLRPALPRLAPLRPRFSSVDAVCGRGCYLTLHSPPIPAEEEEEEEEDKKKKKIYKNRR